MNTIDKQCLYVGQGARITTQTPAHECKQAFCWRHVTVHPIRKRHFARPDIAQGNGASGYAVSMEEVLAPRRPPGFGIVNVAKAQPCQCQDGIIAGMRVEVVVQMPATRRAARSSAWQCR